MIIFGTRGVKSTIKSGNFHCPQCESNKTFRHRKVTKFFTLYFIPLIPLGSAGEYVECDSCKGTFIPRILDNISSKKDEFMAIYQKAIKHSMILIMLADGVIDKNEKKVVLDIINKFGKNDLSPTELETEIELVKKDNTNVNTYLKTIGPSLNEHSKEVIIKCAISVADADGHIDKSELDLISKMGKSMEMSSAHLKGILSEISKKSSVQKSNYNKVENSKIDWEINESTLTFYNGKSFMHYYDEKTQKEESNPAKQNLTDFFWTDNESFEKKSLPDYFQDFEKRKFIVKNLPKEISIAQGKAMPWFGKPGGGDKHFFKFNNNTITISEIQKLNLISYFEYLELDESNISILKDRDNYIYKLDYSVVYENQEFYYGGIKTSLSELYHRKLLKVMKIKKTNFNKNYI